MCTCGSRPGVIPGGRRSSIRSGSVRYTRFSRGQPAISAGRIVGASVVMVAPKGCRVVSLSQVVRSGARARLLTRHEVVGEEIARRGHGDLRLGPRPDLLALRFVRVPDPERVVPDAF